ncbi:ATP-binding protein [Actinoplanes sp. NPDC051343]|uniref:sensor histidine kinase n=1 Tax=Actinoplanes sp. NPDC051343 TaxID=3363906 RepID=UPI0037AF3BE7
MNWIRGWRRRDEPSPPREPDRPAEAESAPPVAPPPFPLPDPWRPIASEFALRLLTLTWEAVHYIGQAEESEPDPERKNLLFRIDHAVTRTRRLAENLRVLTGEAVEDPDQQTTTLQDVVRAAGAPAEHYERLHFGPIVDLAVAAVAADDVIRILTELVDNADRYSPPNEPVNVSAHLTGEGDVLVRVEDSGIGLNPAQVPWFDHVLSGEGRADGGELQPAHVGLPVVAVLTRRHRSLRVRLSPRRPRGTVAMLLIGADLVCEVPHGARPSLPAQQLPPRHAQNSAAARMAPPSPRPRPMIPTQQPAVGAEPTMMLPAQAMPAQAMPSQTMPAQTLRPAAPPMPRRVPASVRGSEPPRPEPVIPAVPHTTAWPDDAAAFNSGVDAARAHFSN